MCAEAVPPVAVCESVGVLGIVMLLCSAVCQRTRVSCSYSSVSGVYHIFGALSNAPALPAMSWARLRRGRAADADGRATRAALAIHFPPCGLPFAVSKSRPKVN